MQTIQNPKSICHHNTIQATPQKEGEKNCKRHRIRSTAAQWHLLDMTGVLYTENFNNMVSHTGPEWGQQSTCHMNRAKVMSFHLWMKNYSSQYQLIAGIVGGEISFLQRRTPDSFPSLECTS